MLRKLKIGLFVILLSITLTLSSVIGIFAAFNSNIGSGVYITYEFIQIPVNLNRDTVSGVVTVHRDTAISWDETEQAVKIVAWDLDGVHNFGGVDYALFDVGAYIRFGSNVVDASLYKVLVIQCKLIAGCTYYGVSTIFPLLEVYNGYPQGGFQKSFTIPHTEEYVYSIIDFTNFSSYNGGNQYLFEGVLTGFRFDYFDEMSENIAYKGQGLFIKSVTMCQTIEAAERLFGSGLN